MLRVKDYGLAREIWIRLEEDEITFPEAARVFGEGPEADRQGVIGPIPIGALQPVLLQDVLRGLKAGELSPPVGLGEWQLLLRLEKLTLLVWTTKCVNRCWSRWMNFWTNVSAKSEQVRVTP